MLFEVLCAHHIGEMGQAIRAFHIIEIYHSPIVIIGTLIAYFTYTPRKIIKNDWLIAK